MLRLYDQGKPGPRHHYTHLFETRNWYDPAGGVLILSPPFDQVLFKWPHVGHSGRIVRRKNVQRRVIEAVHKSWMKGFKVWSNTKRLSIGRELNIRSSQQVKILFSRCGGHRRKQGPRSGTFRSRRQRGVDIPPVSPTLINGRTGLRSRTSH